MTKLLISALVLLCLLSNTSLAEKVKKEKFGKFSPEELNMTVYDKDTTADAVVLYQYAEFDPNTGTFRYHERIKVLKKNGTGYANKGFMGKVKQNLKAAAFNIEGGKLVASKISKQSIFEERVVGDFYRTRIAVPNVKVGTIIEVQYSMEGLPNSVEIQQYIPVIYSAVVLPKHPNIDYTIKEIGLLGAVYAKDNTWIYKNLPAFTKEPYLISSNDYIVKLDIEVTSYIFSNQYYYSMGFFATSWSAVTKHFNDNVNLGKKIGGFNFHINSLVDSIKGVGKDEEELAKLAFDAMKQIKWNGQEACYLSQELSETYKLKSGNVADINSTLLVVLKKLNLKAFPVLLSTRENGKISKYSPTIVKFNYLIVGVDLPSGTKYLDATEEYAPFGLLPSRIMGCLGHPIDASRKECSVLIEQTKRDQKVAVSQFVLSPTGNITGNITINREGYNAVEFKKYLKSKTDHDSYIQELESVNQGWYIDKFNFLNLTDPYQAFVNEYEVNYSSTLGGGEYISFNPFVFVKTSNNPFVREQRRFPISYPNPIEHSYNLTIIIPENYQFAEVPKSSEFFNKDKTMSFVFQTQNQGTKVSIQAKFIVSKLNYETHEYQAIRDLYDKMIQKLNESITIKKI
jgi:hypothetical protein